jgi:hypothetical protein
MFSEEVRDKLGIKKKYEEYEILVWNLNNKRNWVVFAVFVCDLALFISHFFYEFALPLMKISIILQFFFSLTLCLKQIEFNHANYHEEYNKAALLLNVVEEKKKLVDFENHLILGSDLYALMFKSLHKDTAK